MAERVGARQTGQLMSQLERSILGAGGEVQTLEALTPGIQERAERGLLDRLNTIEAQTAQQLQQVPKLAIGQGDHNGTVRSNATTDSRSNEKGNDEGPRNF